MVPYTDSRYTVEFTDGIQSPQAARFILQTGVNNTENNVPILNLESYGSENPSQNSSDFIKDLIQRFKVPFHGITAALHMNVFVNVSDIFNEVTTLPGLTQLLEIAKYSTGQVTGLLKALIRDVMNRIRAEYRLFFSRPSYRELLRCGFNIFMA